jgi:hypothetical protein
MTAMRRRPTHPRGYVLLLMLLLLAVAATALAGASRTALQKAVQASRAQDDLQRRWGVVTCRAALLPKAERVFAGVPAGSAEARLNTALGGQPVGLVFGDEQAKVNVNLLYALGKHEGASRTVREVVQAAGADARVALSPIVPNALDAADDPANDEPSDKAAPGDDEELDLDVQPVFETWGQVFPRVAPADLLARRGGTLPSISAQLTCWGDGLLDARRASRESLLRVTDKALRPSQVTTLLAARAKDPDLDLWETLDTFNLSENRYANAERLLTDTSACYSLWIVTRSGGREWYDLSVAELSPSGGAAAETRVVQW